jgi:hypothetical protein
LASLADAALEAVVVASKITPEEAVRWGALIVNGSVACTMFGLPVLIYFLAVAVGFDTPAATIGAVLSFLASWPLAWLTWSLLVPPWRVWAYERVEDLRELKARGVQAGLNMARRARFRTDGAPDVKTATAHPRTRGNVGSEAKN